MADMGMAEFMKPPTEFDHLRANGIGDEAMGRVVAALDLMEMYGMDRTVARVRLTQMSATGFVSPQVLSDAIDDEYDLEGALRKRFQNVDYHEFTSMIRRHEVPFADVLDAMFPDFDAA